MAGKIRPALFLLPVLYLVQQQEIANARKSKVPNLYSVRHMLVKGAKCGARGAHYCNRTKRGLKSHGMPHSRVIKARYQGALINLPQMWLVSCHARFTMTVNNMVIAR